MINDLYHAAGYGSSEIGMGEWPAILVIDCMTTHFDKAFLPDEGVPPAIRETPLKMRLIKKLPPLLQLARTKGVPVIACNNVYQSARHVMPYWKIDYVLRTNIAKSPHVEIDSRLVDPDRDLVISKTGPSIFHETPLQSYLTRNRVDTLIVTGLNTSGCIRATAIDGFQRGYRVAVVEDAIADAEEGPHRDNLRDIGRRYADIVTTEAMAVHISGYPDR